MDQQDIDALMNQMPDPDDDSSAGQDAESAPSPPADAAGAAGAEAAGDVGVNQDDIDALMAEARDLAGEPAPQPADDPPPEIPAGALDSTGKPLDEAGAAMLAAMAADAEAAESTPAPAPAAEAPPSAREVNVNAFQPADFDLGELTKHANQPLSLLYDVEMHVKIELGRTHMYVEDVLKLGQGSVVELDRLAGDPVDVIVNGRIVARGEVLVLNDNFCVRISEIIADPDARLAS
jgi:flagellar motor switch protein FliN/FliY